MSKPDRLGVGSAPCAIFVISFPSSLELRASRSAQLAFGSLLPNFRRIRAERAARAIGCRESRSGVPGQLPGNSELPELPGLQKRRGWCGASRGSLYEVSAASIGISTWYPRLIVL